MKHFQNIQSLGDLKQQYRTLAKTHHPDLGGDTRIMQEIIAEFTQLYNVWKDNKGANNAYNEDFSGASASQYASYVYDQYTWKGSRYDPNLYGNDLSKMFKEWLKKTYPNCKFSVRQHPGGWTTSLHIGLVGADFYATKDINNTYIQLGINQHFQCTDQLTPLALEIMENVKDFVMSYNYDRSDAMVDYFDVGFYVSWFIGSYEKHFKYTPLQLKSSEPMPKPKLNEAQKMVKKAMKGCKWAIPSYHADFEVLCVDDDNNYPYAICSNNRALIPAKVKALNSVGIMCHLEGERKNLIVLDGFTPELTAALKEKVEEPKSQISSITPQKSEGIEYVDYSEKAFAIVGDTKPIKDKLKELGGRFNSCLKCGAGWVFSKKKEQEIKLALGL